MVNLPEDVHYVISTICCCAFIRITSLGDSTSVFLRGICKRVLFAGESGHTLHHGASHGRSVVVGSRGHPHMSIVPDRVCCRGQARCPSSCHISAQYTGDIFCCNLLPRYYCAYFNVCSLLDSVSNLGLLPPCGKTAPLGTLSSTLC